MIRRAKEKDLPAIAELLKQILVLHHGVRPDIFHTRGSKFSKEQLKEMLNAKKHGCYNITLNVWNDNQRAVSFYEKLGFKPQQTQMEEIL